MKMGMESSLKYNGSINDKQLGLLCETLALSVVMNLLRGTYGKPHCTSYEEEKVPQAGH